MQKQFKVMSETERKQWLAKFQPWYASSLPDIENAQAIGVDERKLFDEGLNLINVFPFCHSFVAETLRFRDYRSRKRPLRRLADEVARQAQKELGLSEVVDLTNPDLLKPHVGRPTKQEAAARRIASEQKRKEAERKDKTLFGTMADIPTVKAVAPDTVSGSVSGGSLFHLDQLKWLMSDALKEAVGTVRTLRATAAEAATKAKQMAEDGRKSDDIKPYAQRAIDDTEAYERIYERVDKEMATVYVRLKEDSRYIADMESKGVDIQQLRANLRPYFDKQDDKELFKQQVIADIDANDPEQKAARAKEEERRAKVLNIIKYLMRKDKENTLHRVEEMKRRYQELIILAGEDYAKDYLPVVNAAIEDYEKNVKPKDEAAKTDKETSVKTEKKKLVKTKATKKKSVKKTSSSHRSSSKSEKKK